MVVAPSTFASSLESVLPTMAEEVPYQTVGKDDFSIESKKQHNI